MSDRELSLYRLISDQTQLSHYKDVDEPAVAALHDVLCSHAGFGNGVDKGGSRERWQIDQLLYIVRALWSNLIVGRNDAQTPDWKTCQCGSIRERANAFTRRKIGVCVTSNRSVRQFTVEISEVGDCSSKLVYKDLTQTTGQLTCKKEIPDLMVWELFTYPLFLLFCLPFVQILPPQMFDSTPFQRGTFT
jgi:hypothetical protein